MPVTQSFGRFHTGTGNPMDEKQKRKPLRVWMIADVFFPDTIGGAGRAARELSRALAARGHRVCVFSRNPDGRFNDEEKIGERLVVKRFKIGRRGGIGALVDELKNSTAAIRRSQKYSAPDVFCIHQSLASLGPMAAGLLKGKTVFYFFHSPWHEEYLIKNRGKKGSQAIRGLVAAAMRKIEQRVTDRADRILTISHYMAGRAADIHGHSMDKLAVVPAGVDTTVFRLPEDGKPAVRKRLGLPGNRMLFLTVRNLVPRMGLETLIEAFGKAKRLSEEATLLIAGTGPIGERLDRLIRAYRLEGIVQRLGRVSEDRLIQLYQAADFFLLPTAELEGFGLVILEAMACGTPVVGTPVGAIPEILSAFDRRLVFESRTASAMRRRLEDIVKRPDAFRFSPEQCRRFVIERYSWEKAALVFESLSDSSLR